MSTGTMKVRTEQTWRQLCRRENRLYACFVFCFGTCVRRLILFNLLGKCDNVNAIVMIVVLAFYD